MVLCSWCCQPAFERLTCTVLLVSCWGQWTCKVGAENVLADLVRMFLVLGLIQHRSVQQKQHFLSTYTTSCRNVINMCDRWVSATFFLGSVVETMVLKETTDYTLRS